MLISNNHPLVKTIKTIHYFKKSTIEYSLTHTLKENKGDFKSATPYLKVRAIPENTKIQSGQKNNSQGVYWFNKITQEINTQNKTIRQQLDTYANEKVICCIETTKKEVHIYGTIDQPLTFIYKDIEGVTLSQTVGHEISVTGDTYNSYRTISTLDFYDIDGLPAWLPLAL